VKRSYVSELYINFILGSFTMRTISTLLRAYFALLLTFAAVQASDEQPGVTKAREAAQAQQKGRLNQAIKLYSEALEDRLLAGDRKGIIYVDRGVLYARLGQPKQAIEDFNSAAKLFPEYAAAYNNRGSLLLSLGYTDEALKDFDRAVILAPGYIAALNNRAGALILKGKLGLALDDYTKAIKLAPDETAPLAGRARVKIVQERPYAAMRDLNVALLSDGRFVLGYRLRGQVHADLNDYYRAAQDLSRAIAFAPANAGAYLARGRVYLKARNPQAAALDFSKVIELRPTSPTAYRERGHVNVLLNNFVQAEQDLGKSLALNPRAAVTFAYRALMYKKQGRPELGAQEIEKAMRLNSEDPTIVWAKGEIEEAMLDTAAAEKSYRRALDLDPKLKNAYFGLIRIGKPPANDSIALENLAFGPWSIVRENTKFTAQHEDYPKLRVPMEMVSDGQPQIVSWKEREDNFKGIGILQFKAGRTETRNGVVDVEYAVLINLINQTVMDLVPQRIGKDITKWTWRKNGRIAIAAVDGLNTEHVLNSRLSDSVQQRKSKKTTVKRRKPRKRKRREQPKSLFEMLVGNDSR